MSENTRPLRDFFQTLPTGSPTFLVGTDLTRIPVSSFGTGIVVSIAPGTGISVNSSTPSIPIVSLSPSSIASLSLANTALQPGTVTVSDIDATGTPSSTTYLRGDGSWHTPSGGGGGGQVDSVVAGDGVEVDDTDPVNPIVGLDTASVASLALADTSVQPVRKIDAGTGLTGGGDLSADRTISLNSTSTASLALADTAVQPARKLDSGTGLTGGGDLSADRTIALSSASISSLGLADTALQPSSIGATVQAYDASTAKTNADQQWTSSQRPSVTSLSVSSGSIAWTLASSNDFSVILNANATLNLPSDIASHVGQKGRILITQDGTGGRTFSVNANIIPLGSSSVPSIPSGAGEMAYFAYDVISATQIVFTLNGVGE